MPLMVHSSFLPVEMHSPGGIGRSLRRLPFMSLGPAQKTSDTVAFVFFSHVISHLFSQLHWKELPRRSLMKGRKGDIIIFNITLGTFTGLHVERCKMFSIYWLEEKIEQVEVPHSSVSHLRCTLKFTGPTYCMTSKIIKMIMQTIALHTAGKIFHLWNLNWWLFDWHVVKRFCTVVRTICWFCLFFFSFFF